jgi:hypothetical protein
MLYDTRTKAWEALHVPSVVAAELVQRDSTRVFCWGYRPTLVWPGSIAGSAQPRLRREGGVVAAMNAVLERDWRLGGSGLWARCASWTCAALHHAAATR